MHAGYSLVVGGEAFGEGLVRGGAGLEDCLADYATDHDQMFLRFH